MFQIQGETVTLGPHKLVTLSYYMNDKPEVHEDKIPAKVTLPVYGKLPPCSPKSLVQVFFLLLSQSNSLCYYFLVNIFIGCKLSNILQMLEALALIQQIFFSSQDNDHQSLGNPGDKYSARDTVIYWLFCFCYPLEKETHSSM